MRRQAPELGPMRYAYAWPARDISDLRAELRDCRLYMSWHHIERVDMDIGD